jgi:small-conductance mechanosensitive channel
MISRPADPKEPWFPTHKDDWVILSDETYGKVIRQTPEQVTLLKLGGSLKTYPVGEFLGLMPENLSHGFRIQTVFGIDYSHQSIATGEVVEILSRELAARLAHDLGREELRSVKVEFQAASASSLDYAVLSDFSGSLASRYRFLGRKVQQHCVEICNEQGWVIPFAQITVHQAPTVTRESEF